MEPSPAVAWADAASGRPCNSAKGDAVSWGTGTNMFLRQGPSWLDGIQVIGVGWEVLETGALGCDDASDARVLVRLGIVEDDDVPFFEFGDQGAPQPGAEPLGVGRLEHRAQDGKSPPSQRTYHGEVGAPVCGAGLIEFLASPDPGVGATHGDVASRLVEEDEFVRVYSPDSTDETPTLQLDI